jgi:hypothetical protein
MRCATAAQILGKAGSANARIAPQLGTRTREVYDLFQANRGRPVEFQTNDSATDKTIIVRLIDFYGLDIRCLRNGSRRVGRRSLWLLAGEWFGRVYVDYVAQHIESLSRPTGNETAADSSAPQPTAVVSANSESPVGDRQTVGVSESRCSAAPAVDARCVVKNVSTFAVTQASRTQAKPSSSDNSKSSTIGA